MRYSWFGWLDCLSCAVGSQGELARRRNAGDRLQFGRAALPIQRKKPFQINIFIKQSSVDLCVEPLFLSLSLYRSVLRKPVCIHYSVAIRFYLEMASSVKYYSYYLLQPILRNRNQHMLRIYVNSIYIYIYTDLSANELSNLYSSTKCSNKLDKNHSTKRTLCVKQKEEDKTNSSKIHLANALYIV